MSRTSNTGHVLGLVLRHTLPKVSLKLRATLTLALVTGMAAAEDFSGYWGYVKSGSFELELVERGTLVCGQVTAISGERVDFSGVVGSQTTRELVVHFTSGFAEKGSQGIATLKRVGNKLEWRVSQEPAGESWIWDSVDLKLRGWQSGREKVVSAWCAPQWKKIQEGQLERIQLLDF